MAGLSRSAAILKHASLVRTSAWALMIPLAYVTGWLKSVTFVALCSLYANVASDFASWRADDNPQLTRIEEMLERLLAHLEVTDDEQAADRAGAEDAPAPPGR